MSVVLWTMALSGSAKTARIGAFTEGLPRWSRGIRRRLKVRVTGWR